MYLAPALSQMPPLRYRGEGQTLEEAKMTTEEKSLGSYELTGKRSRFERIEYPGADSKKSPSLLEVLTLLIFPFRAAHLGVTYLKSCHALWFLMGKVGTGPGRGNCARIKIYIFVRL